MDQPARALQHAVQHALAGRHLPQHVHVQPALAAAHVVGDARLADRRLDRVADQLLVALQPGLAAVDQRHQLAALVDIVAVDAGEGADAAGRRPGAAAEPVRDRDALAAFDQRPDLATGQDQGLEGESPMLSYGGPSQAHAVVRARCRAGRKPRSAGHDARSSLTQMYASAPARQGAGRFPRMQGCRGGDAEARRRRVSPRDGAGAARDRGAGARPGPRLQRPRRPRRPRLDRGLLAGLLVDRRAC